jgi:hypothetical protein
VYPGGSRVRDKDYIESHCRTCAKIVVGVRNIANSMAADNWIRMSKPEASKNNARVIRSQISNPGRTPSRSGKIITRTVADAKGQLR